MAGNLGFEVFLAEDATATFDRIGPDGVTYKSDQIHCTSLVSLHEEFATIVKTSQMLEPFQLNSYASI